MLDIVAIFLVITALLAYLNHRFLRLPTTIGVMASALGLSLTFVGLDALGITHSLRDAEESLVRSVDFGNVLLQGMLSLLLFAGALHVNFRQLKAYRIQVIALAVVSTVASTAIIGVAMWLLLPKLGVTLPLPYCMVFGALISPTDPVAVMGILHSSGAPKNLELVIVGESLFNDGVGVVIFALLLGMAVSGVTPTFQTGLLTLMREAGGGLGFGAALGYITFRLLKSVDHYQVEVLITLAAVLGGYALANHLHVSGPLAMVVTGVMIGNRGRADAMSETTRRYVDMFWELIDEILNAVLFVLIGMEVLLVAFPGRILFAGACAAVVTLLARLLTVGLPVAAIGRAFRLPRGAWTVLTWGGLRGGISVALALSIPTGPERNIVLALTYCVVVLSILGQGLTVASVVKRTLKRPAN
ncbi:sodium:proton antiporter (plasmid) [Burkholderia sp. PAMC 28687]|uniref:cation:proton antiporter n=1 Tax=Burkholderia sp. PAMC 28687 TaxID=1795874 RepID=UPI0007835904|nr:sodium:proton antiporter [Burkholderia sp. PAMC 28687]AMM18447.1 sodium:proton antiporter [Burkholderia sp. PAMC 28687]